MMFSFFFLRQDLFWGFFILSEWTYSISEYLLKANYWTLQLVVECDGDEQMLIVIKHSEHCIVGNL